MFRSTASAIPVLTNLQLWCGVVVVQLFPLFIMPVWLYPQDPRWSALLLPLLLLTPLHWALIHEAIHKSLHPKTKHNDHLGRGLGVVLFTAFEGLRFGHLMHHRFNRRLDSEYYDPETVSAARANLRYYWTLLFGLYAMEVVAPYLLALLPEKILRPLFHKLAKDYEGKPLPELEVAANNYFFRKNRLNKLRCDVALITLLLAATIYVHGTYWPMLLVYFMGRGFIISVHDNVYHYNTALDNSEPAKELALPPVLSAGMLHFNYHLSHHLSPGTPWSKLPEIHKQQKLAYDEEFFSALISQKNGMVPSRAAEDTTQLNVGLS